MTHCNIDAILYIDKQLTKDLMILIITALLLTRTANHDVRISGLITIGIFELIIELGMLGSLR